jgi:hypothetical protein
MSTTTPANNVIDEQKGPVRNRKDIALSGIGWAAVLIALVSGFVPQFRHTANSCG